MRALDAQPPLFKLLATWPKHELAPLSTGQRDTPAIRTAGLAAKNRLKLRQDFRAIMRKILKEKLPLREGERVMYVSKLEARRCAA